MRTCGARRGRLASLCLRALVAFALSVVSHAFAHTAVSVERFKFPHKLNGDGETALVDFEVFTPQSSDPRLPFLFGQNGVNVDAKYYSSVRRLFESPPPSRSPSPRRRS